MMIYGFTTNTGEKHIFKVEYARDVESSYCSAPYLWEYEIADSGIEYPNPEDPPTKFGSIITAKIYGGSSMYTLARIGKNSRFPWVGTLKDNGAASCYQNSDIESWHLFDPSTPDVSKYLFEEFSLILDEDQERDLRDFLANP
jgi:hypothetical protein